MRRLLAAAVVFCVVSSIDAQPAFPTPNVTSTIPTDVNTPFPGVAPNLPYFDDFSWQEFTALTWPAQTTSVTPLARGVPDTGKKYGDLSGPLVFQTWKSDYELFLPGGAAPSPWTSYSSPSPCGGNLVPYQTLLASFNKFHGFNEAGFGVDAGPLISQNRQYTRYETRVNMIQYNFIINPGSPYPGPLYLAANLPASTNSNPALNFPTGSIEMKAGWRVLTGVPPSEQQRYFTTTAWLLDPVSGMCSQATVGLVALHIVNKTARFPNWVWSTFEHADNVPAISGETPYGSAPWGYNDNNPSNQKLGPMGMPISPSNPPSPNPTPSQAIRLRAIAASTQQTNAMYHATPQMQGTIWQNYHLTLTQWPINNGTSTFPSTTQPQPQTNTANVAAETWFQATTATSCMACHQVAKNKKFDFVWFLPIGAYDPNAPVASQAPMNAFTLANRTAALKAGVSRRAAPKNARTDALATLQQFIKRHGPKNRTTDD